MFGKKKRYVDIPQSVRDKGAGAVRQWTEESGYRYDALAGKAYFYDEDTAGDRPQGDKPQQQGQRQGMNGERREQEERGTPRKEGSDTRTLLTDTYRVEEDGNKPGTILTQEERDDHYREQGEFSFQESRAREYSPGLSALQRQLYQIDGGKYYPGGSEDLGGDGYFGDNTVKALKKFAADNGIESDGRTITPELRRLIIEKARKEPMSVQ